MKEDQLLRISEDLFFNYTNNAIEVIERIPYYAQSEKHHLIKDFIWNHTVIKTGYVNNETRYTDSRLVLMTSDIVFCQQLRSSLTDYISRHIIDHKQVMELISDHIIHPFLLFIKGRFVKWSELYVYADTRYTYLVIESETFKYDESAPLQDSDIVILHLPIQNLTYNENCVHDETRTLIFGFDEKGVLEVSGTTRIYMDQSSTGYIQLRLPNTTINEDDIQVPDECQLYPSNILVFKDNLIYPEANIVISPYNTMTIDGGLTKGLEYKMFYDKSSNIPYNNVSQVINHNYLKDKYLNTKPNPEWLSILQQKFDFNFNTEKSYDENMVDFGIYLQKYNYRTLIDQIKSEHVYVMHGYLSELTDIFNHQFIYPAHFDSADIGCMLFINGILCNSSITKYESYGVLVDLSGYAAGSVYEFISFNNRLEDTIPCRIDSAIPDYKYFSGYDDFGSEYDLYCCNHPDSVFDLFKTDPDKAYLIGYKVDPSRYTVYDDGIVFDSFYSSLDNGFIYKVPRNKFVYSYQKVPDSPLRYALHLDEYSYRFCTDKNKYMVFVDGFRLHSSLYRVIIPTPSTPFNDQAIFFSIAINPGQTVEVIYSPMSIIDEVYIDDLDHSSEVGTGVDQMGYITGPENYKVPMSRDLQFFFVNGIKIPYDYLMDISYNKERMIVNMNNIDNLSLIGSDPELIEFFKSLNLEHSNLDNLYDNHTKNEINIITNTFTTVSDIVVARRKEVDDHALINEIIRYYYGPVNKGIPFRYDYDASVYAEVDRAGNIIIDVMDATKNVNLVIEGSN